MRGFRCSSCGQWHDGAPSLSWERPLHYFAVPPDERARRCITSAETCIVDNEAFYVRGCIEVPVKDTEEIISFAVWVSLSEVSFRTFSHLLPEQKRSSSGPFFAWLCDPIPTYPETEPLKAKLHLRDDGISPYIELEPTNYPLAVEQRHGASEARVQELYGWLEKQKGDG